MDRQLSDVAMKLATPPKGILAADESTKTCCARFESVHVPCTEEKRREYREVFIGAPHLGDSISGIILVEETLNQKTADRTPFLEVLEEAGVYAGVKVDGGLEAMNDNGEHITLGLDGLGERLATYKKLGCAFTKWRAAFLIGEMLPSDMAIRENAIRMAEYARLVQNAGLVPIVEPEVLMDGTHSAEQAERVITKVIFETVKALNEKGVFMEGIILKTAMAVSGKEALDRAESSEVAERTIRMLSLGVPENIGGVVFLSGGQTSEEADTNFDAIMKRKSEVPFPMTFSFARAIQQPVLDAWAKGEEVSALRELFISGVTKIAQ